MWAEWERTESQRLKKTVTGKIMKIDEKAHLCKPLNRP
jgi:hypothetical protein